METTIPALLLAVHGGLEIEVRRILSAGESANVTDRFGMTPLMAAVMGGHATLVRLLIDAGACLTMSNSWGMTALDLARWNGYGEISALLEAAAGRKGQGKQG